MDLNLVFSVDLDAEHTGGKTQDGPYQEESERPWEKKMISPAGKAWAEKGLWQSM